MGASLDLPGASLLALYSSTASCLVLVCPLDLSLCPPSTDTASICCQAALDFSSGCRCETSCARMCYLAEDEEAGRELGRTTWLPELVPQTVLNEKTEDVVADAVEQKGAKDVLINVFGTDSW